MSSVKIDYVAKNDKITSRNFTKIFYNHGMEGYNCAGDGHSPRGMALYM